MTQTPRKVLLIGYGNPGRIDDGLGPALAQRIAQQHIPGVTVDADYQLTVEDAAAVAQYDVVIFADASTSGAEPFSFTRLAPTSAASFSTHSVSPGAVLGLAQDLFGHAPPTYVLAIRGYVFNEYAERLSDVAQQNLSAAVEFVADVLRRGNFEESIVGSAAAEPACTNHEHGDA